MSSLYAGNDVFPADYTIPDDGESENASTVNIPAEALGDRTKYLQNRGGGATLADLAALVAITVPLNGWRRFVKGYGIYRFDSASALAAASPYVLIPTDATPGRWLHELFELRNSQAGVEGFAGTTSAGAVDVVGTTWPKFKAGTRTVQRAVSLLNYQLALNIAAPSDMDVPVSKDAYFYPAPRDAGCGWKFKTGSLITTGTGPLGGTDKAQGVMLSLDPFLHDGATLTNVILVVEAGAGHAALPSLPLRIGLFRQVSTTTASFESMFSAGDFIVDYSANATDYELVHNFNVAPDVGEIIDKHSYSYFLQIWTERDSADITHIAAGLKVHGLYLVMGGIADMRFP